MKNEIDKEQNDGELDLFELLLIAVNKWWLICLLALIFGVGAFLYKYNTSSKRYQAEAVLYAQQTPTDYVRLGLEEGHYQAPRQNLLGNTWHVVLNSQDFITKLAECEYQFKLADGKFFKGNMLDFLKQEKLEQKKNEISKPIQITRVVRAMIKLSFDKRSGLLAINATTSNPELSAQLANAFAKEAIDWYRKKLNANTKDNLDFVKNQLKTARISMENSEKNLLLFLKNNRGFNQEMATESKQKNISTEAQFYSLELSKLRNDLDMRTALYRKLLQKHELLQIETAKKMPSIMLLKTAEVPMRRLGKGSFKAGLFGGFAGIAIALAWIYLNAFLDGNRREELRRAFKRGFIGKA